MFHDVSESRFVLFTSSLFTTKSCWISSSNVGRQKSSPKNINLSLQDMQRGPWHIPSKGRHCRGFRRGAGALTLLFLAPLAPLPASAPRTSGRPAGWRISPGITTRIATRIATRISQRISQISKDGFSQSWPRSRSNHATRSESFKKTSSRFSFYQLESCTEGRDKMMGGKDRGPGDKAWGAFSDRQK